MSPVASFVLAYGAYVALLHAAPGPWRDWKAGREGQAFDPWTLQHVIWGVIANRWGLSQRELMALASANELLELGVRVKRPDLLWGTPETPANVAVDLGANALGWWLSELAGR